MKTVGLSLLAGAIGYAIGLFGGIVLVNLFSSNTHDRSVEAAMTGAFVVGPALALLSFIVCLVLRLAR